MHNKPHTHRVPDIIVPVRLASTSPGELCCQATALVISDTLNVRGFFLVRDNSHDCYHLNWPRGYKTFFLLINFSCS